MVPLGCESAQNGNLTLLRRVVRGQVAHSGLVLPCPQHAGSAGLEIGFLTRQHKAAAARFDTLHGQPKILKASENFMRVPYPAVAFAGGGKLAIVNGTNHDQSKQRGCENQLHLAIQPIRGLHFTWLLD